MVEVLTLNAFGHAMELLLQHAESLKPQGRNVLAHLFDPFAHREDVMMDGVYYLVQAA